MLSLFDPLFTVAIHESPVLDVFTSSENSWIVTDSEVFENIAQEVDGMRVLKVSPIVTPVALTKFHCAISLSQLAMCYERWARKCVKHVAAEPEFSMSSGLMTPMIK